MTRLSTATVALQHAPETRPAAAAAEVPRESVFPGGRCVASAEVLVMMVKDCRHAREHYSVGSHWGMAGASYVLMLLPCAEQDISGRAVGLLADIVAEPSSRS